jgi:hypothetical protein
MVWDASRTIEAGPSASIAAIDSGWHWATVTNSSPVLTLA